MGKVGQGQGRFEKKSVKKFLGRSKLLAGQGQARLRSRGPEMWMKAAGGSEGNHGIVRMRTPHVSSKELYDGDLSLDHI